MALLTLDDLSLAFRGVYVLDNVSRFVESGEKIGLLGRNGTGKTTLLRMIAGDQEPDAGACVLASGKRASFLPQEVPGDLSGQVFGVVQEALSLQVSEGQIETWEAEAKSKQIIDLMGLDSDVDISSLSAGRKRRVLLARALVTKPDLLYLMSQQIILILRRLSGWKSFWLLGEAPYFLSRTIVGFSGE